MKTDNYMLVMHLDRNAFTEFTRNQWLPNKPPPAWPENYSAVALVGGDDVDLAYRLTNHICAPWPDNEGVAAIGPHEHRSTSAGDVVVMPDGRVLRCERAGWEQLGEESIRPGQGPALLQLFLHHMEKSSERGHK